MKDKQLIRGVALCLWFLLVNCAVLTAQEVSARIRVVHDDVAIGQATVTVGASARITDPAGEVLIRLSPGRYPLRIERAGFEQHSSILELVRDTILTIELEAEALELEEIIVQTTRGERRIQDEPTKIEVVTREEIEEKLLMTPGSISMLLNETSGLRVQETSPALGGAMIRIQGLEGRYTQLLSDGLPLYGGQTGSLGVLQIPPMDLAQVEVIKGAASALYGSAALGGVVNLISRRPADETELLLNRTTRGGSDVVLWNSRELGEALGYTMLLSGHSQDRQDIDRDGWADIAKYRRLVARPRLFLRSDAGTQVMFTAGAMLEDREGGGRVGDETILQQSLETARFDVGTSARFLVSDRRMLDFRGSASRIGHDHQNGAASDSDAHSTLFAETSLRGADGAHLWVVGAALQRDAYRADVAKAFEYTYLVPSVFAQDEITLGDRMTASVSVRGDWHNEYGTFVTPRLALLVRTSEEGSVRLAGGTGYFGPTPFVERTEEVGLSRVLPLSGLKAERARHLAADLNWSPAPFEANLSLFASRIEDRIEAIDSAGQLALVNVHGSTRTQGMESLVRYRREPFVVTASYTYVNASQAERGGGREVVPMVPRHSAGLVAMAEEHDKGRIGVEVYYTGVQQLEENPFRDRSKANVIVGVLVERSIGRVRAFMNLENLTNVRQTRFDRLIRPATTEYGRWTTDLWAPVEGRTINGGVRIALH